MLALADCSARHPRDRLALVHEDARWTFGELDARSASWARSLVAHGVGQDDLIAFSLPNGPEFIALAFGIYRAGATPAPISSALPDFERDAILSVMRPRLFLDAGDRPDARAPAFEARKPIGGARLRIVDDDGSDVPAGTIGEVFAMPPGGPRSSYRYIGAARRQTADGWESVGDCGYLDADGYLFLADRKNDLIISGGVNIWPAEVEAALLRHPAILACAVFGEPDIDLGQRVHAIVETRDPLTLDALRLFVGRYLAREKMPRALTCRDAPVRDDAGKVRRFALRKVAT